MALLDLLILVLYFRYRSNIHDKAWEQTPSHLHTPSLCKGLPLLLCLCCENKNEHDNTPPSPATPTHGNTKKRGVTDNVSGCYPGNDKGEGEVFPLFALFSFWLVLECSHPTPATGNGGGTGGTPYARENFQKKRRGGLESGKRR